MHWCGRVLFIVHFYYDIPEASRFPPLFVDELYQYMGRQKGWFNNDMNGKDAVGC